jgi:hypothetical protein
MKRKVAGVYMLVSRATGERYVGCSYNLLVRLRTHFCGLRNGHSNKKINRIREGSFVYQLIEVLSPGDDLLEREAYWIERLQPELNDTPGRPSFEGALNVQLNVRLNGILVDALRTLHGESAGRALRAIIVEEMMKCGDLEAKDVPERVHQDILLCNSRIPIAQAACAERGRK